MFIVTFSECQKGIELISIFYTEQKVYSYFLLSCRVCQGQITLFGNKEFYPRNVIHMKTEKYFSALKLSN